MSDIHGNYWQALRNQTAETEYAISELFDNSVDAGATQVDIKFKGGLKSGTFTISDNGRGIADVEGMFTLGKSSDKGDDSSGRYGAGSKPSIAYFGTHISVVSVHEGVRRSLTWDTNKDTASGVWKSGLTVHPEEPTTDPSGTVINVTCPHTHRIASTGVEESLSQHLSPALDRGICITYNGSPLKPFDFRWTGVPSTKSGEINGHKYEITAGIAAGIPQAQCGLHVEKLHRSLPKYLNSRDGLVGDKSLLVRVRLIQTAHSKNEWPLDPTSKAFLSDSKQWQELRSVITDLVRGDADSNQDKQKLVMLTGISSRFENILNGRSRRSNTGNHGIDPNGSGFEQDNDPSGSKGNGGERKPSGSECGRNPGDTHERKNEKAAGIRIEWKEDNPGGQWADYSLKDGQLTVICFTDRVNASPSEGPRASAGFVADSLWAAFADTGDMSYAKCVGCTDEKVSYLDFKALAYDFLLGKM